MCCRGLESYQMHQIKKELTVDFRIIKAMLTGATNKQISSQLDLPLFTVQRGVRSLLARRIVNSFFQIGSEPLDLKSGLIHIYLSNGNIHDISKKTVFNRLQNMATSISTENYEPRKCRIYDCYCLTEITINRIEKCFYFINQLDGCMLLIRSLKKRLVRYDD